LHQEVRTSASEESSLVRTEQHPPPDCGRLLWTAPYCLSSDQRSLSYPFPFSRKYFYVLFTFALLHWSFTRVIFYF